MAALRVAKSPKTRRKARSRCAKVACAAEQIPEVERQRGGEAPHIQPGKRRWRAGVRGWLMLEVQTCSEVPGRPEIAGIKYDSIVLQCYTDCIQYNVENRSIVELLGSASPLPET